MQREIRRREFLQRTALATGAALFTGAAAAYAAPAKMLFYDKVDPALFRGINEARNPARLSGLEKLHVPVIEAPERVRAGQVFAVRVRVGEVLHPMLENHYIHYAVLLAGNEPVGRVDFTWRFSSPEATFQLKLDKPVTLVVREYCNLHGLWQNSRQIAVS